MVSHQYLVSVILVVWNNERFLFECLNALQKQTFQEFEIILIDNGSSNATYLYELQAVYPNHEITIKELDSNFGFAVANNIGVHLARGKWIVLLNADAFPEPNWLEKLIQSMEQNPRYSLFSSRQIQYRIPKLLDGAGDAYHISGLAWRSDYNLPVDKYGLIQKEMFSPCAAAALYSREEFLKAGGFDEDYFSYFEDVDLGFRLRLSGRKCLYVPGAIVYHVGSVSTGKRSDFSVYYGYRNMIWTFVKNMPSLLFGLFLPLHILSIIFFVFYFITRGQGKIIIKAIFDAILGLPKAFKKRKLIQKNIQIKSKDLLKVMSTGLFVPYFEFIERNRK